MAVESEKEEALSGDEPRLNEWHWIWEHILTHYQEPHDEEGLRTVLARPVKGDNENRKTASDPSGLVRKEATDHDCESNVVSKGERETLIKKRKLGRDN